METIIKVFVSVFFTVILGLVGIGFVSSSASARNAEAYLEDAVTEISASNCATSVIDEWIANAPSENETYELNVTTPTANAGTQNRYAKVTLSYHYQIPFLGIDDVRTISSMTR